MGKLWLPWPLATEGENFEPWQFTAADGVNFNSSGGSPVGRLKNKVALITAPVIGIGQSSAKLFAHEGPKVLVNVDAKSAEDTVQLISGQCGESYALGFPADITREEDCRKMIAMAIATFGKLDTLFNNAGVVVGGTVHEIKTKVATPSLLRPFASLPHPEETRQEFIARQPVGRRGRPEEVAGAALYLASDESLFVTGITLIVNGGMSL